MESRYGYRADGQENVTHRESLLAFDKVVQEVKDEMKRQDREDEFVGVKASNHYSNATCLSSRRLDHLYHNQIHHP
jgi:hypothetical protein